MPAHTSRLDFMLKPLCCRATSFGAKVNEQMIKLVKIKLTVCSAIFLSAVAAPPASADVQPVPHVDLNRYLGTWYEIASMPQRFQRQCVANTRAEYVAGEEGTVDVLNSCEKADGSLANAEGHARVVDAASNSKLEVTFVRFLGRWIYLFGGDYWVIDLDPNYEYAVVGHPDRSYGWILSRTPGLANDNLTKIATQLTAQGYDLCAFDVTRQEGGGYGGDAKRLCDYLKAL